MSKPKPIYTDDWVTLYRGDCLEVLPHLGTVDHVITDPPYSKHVHTKSRAGARVLDSCGRPAAFSRSVDFGFGCVTDDVRSACCDAWRPKRWALVFSDVESAHLWRKELIARAGLDYARTGAWVKGNPTPQFTGDRPGVGFEAVTICHAAGRKRWNGGGKAGVWHHNTALTRDHKSTRLHPTEKPLSLMRELVTLFTDQGETVLDPFAGSGTTGRACKDLGRKCILIEREEKYCDVIIKRLAQERLL